MRWRVLFIGAVLAAGCAPDLSMGKVCGDGIVGINEPCDSPDPMKAARVDLTAVELCTIMKIANANNSIFDETKALCIAGQAPGFLESSPDGDAQMAKLRAECKDGDWVFDHFNDGLKGGRVRFDADRFKACAAKGKRARATASPKIFERETLDAISKDDDCRGVWTPLVGENGVCVDEWDCPLGTSCEADDPTVATLRCLKPAGLGALCGPFRQCDSATLYCSDATGTCIPHENIGHACSASTDCIMGTYCAGPVNQKTCTALLTAGASCGASDHCADGLNCINKLCVAPAADGTLCDGTTCSGICSVCRPEHDGDSKSQFKCLPRVSLGGPCSLLDASSSYACMEGLYCNLNTGHCEAQLVAGANCTSSGAPCAKGLWCDTASTQSCIALPTSSGDPCDPAKGGGCPTPLLCTGAAGAKTCQLPPRIGEVCLSGVCEGGSFCNAGTCEAKRPVGAPCDAGIPCADGSFCNVDTCEAKRPVGAPCDAGIPCADGSFCNVGTCEAKRPVGALCASENQCLYPGTCYRGKCVPVAPKGWLGCSDMRDDLPSIFAMGMLGVLVRRRRKR